jgi:hypothetical protein
MLMSSHIALPILYHRLVALSPYPQRYSDSLRQGGFGLKLPATAPATLFSLCCIRRRILATPNPDD